MWNIEKKSKVTQFKKTYRKKILCTFPIPIILEKYLKNLKIFLWKKRCFRLRCIILWIYYFWYIKLIIYEILNLIYNFHYFYFSGKFFPFISLFFGNNFFLYKFYAFYIPIYSFSTPTLKCDSKIKFCGFINFGILN